MFLADGGAAAMVWASWTWGEVLERDGPVSGIPATVMAGAWIPLAGPNTSRGVSMALGCHWPSMSLVGAYASRGAYHLGCGDDGLDVGPDESHEEADSFRRLAGFERHPGKEVHSFFGALIKEVPLKKVGHTWVVLAPLKVRVLSGDGLPDCDAPRYVSDFWSLDAEAIRSGVSPELHARGTEFLLRRYLRPLTRVSRFGASVPVLGSRQPARAWRMRVQTAEGPRDPLLVPPGRGGSRAEGALMEALARETEDWDIPLLPSRPMTREVVGIELAYEQFSSLHLPPGESGGAESVPQLLARLGSQMAPAPLGGGHRDVAFLHRVGPKVVSEFEGADFRVTQAGSRPSRGPYGSWGS